MTPLLIASAQLVVSRVAACAARKAAAASSNATKPRLRMMVLGNGMPLSLWQPKPEVHLEACRLQAPRHNPCLSCYGQKQIETPHLDRLAGEGSRFTQFVEGEAARRGFVRCFLLLASIKGVSLWRRPGCQYNPVVIRSSLLRCFLLLPVTRASPFRLVIYEPAVA